MKNDDKMIDALLQEHARRGKDDDVEFLNELEQRLDQEEGRVNACKPSRCASKRGGLKMGLTTGLGVAAAFTVAAIGFYGWKEHNDRERTAMAEHDVELPAVLAEQKRSRESHAREKRKISLGAKHALSDSKPVIQDARQAPPSDRLDKSIRIDSDSAMGCDEKLEEFRVGKESRINVAKPSRSGGIRPSSRRKAAERSQTGRGSIIKGKEFGQDLSTAGGYMDLFGRGNRYGSLTDNTFKSPWKEPLSTFSVDVDTASYANIRRMIQSGQSIPADAVRIEEMINYFDYSYPQPEGQHPFSVNVETASCPWNPEHRLVKVGLQGKEIAKEARPAANLVFLLDVSGSMNSQDKLPLLVDSMKILLKELNADDSVSIVVYAGAQGLALPPTHVDEQGRKTILAKLNNFRSGGSTNGGAGITLAYKMAKKHFVKGGVNRVILGTDGDFNVGITGTDSLVSMVEREAKSGVSLSVLGFGQGNLNDAMLEKITNKGNGNYYYIDNLREGRKVFLDDMMGTMVTIAKDVKIQVEFNPAKVKSYRLIGYANRMLKAEDFKNKRIDAGEIGAGHTVTALYEIVPGNAAEDAALIDDLEYQKKNVASKPVERNAVDSPNMLTVKLAYKQPEATKETESTYFKTRVKDSEKPWQQASADFKFASSVSLFGMLQRQSEYAGQGTYQLVRQLAEQGRGDDPKGLRTEFSDLVRKVAE